MTPAILMKFGVKEARELVAEINGLRSQDRAHLDPAGILFGIPNLEKLKKRLENPLAPVEEVKIPIEGTEQQ